MTRRRRSDGGCVKGGGVVKKAVKKKAFRELLGGVWLFSLCTKKELGAIGSLVTQIDVSAGKVLATQGQTGSEFFVIVAGGAEATRSDVPIGMLGAGSFFGEMSLLEHRPRVATVTTTEPTTVFVLTSKEFDKLVASMPSVDRKMLTVMANRLRDLEDRYVPLDDRVIAKDIA
jgi:CRP/FNR family transcriptional regulator, cyclic AMP receptor protein